MLQIYTKQLGTRHSLRMESRPKLHSWSRFEEGLGKRRSLNLGWKDETRMKMFLHFNVSSTQEDNICNFFVQVKQKEFSKCCEENKKDWFILMLLLHQPHLHYVWRLREGEKKIEKKNIEVNKLQEIERENEKLTNNIFYGYELSSNKIYNHYVGILIVNILETAFLFFRSRANAKNIILYKTKLTNENQAKG